MKFLAALFVALIFASIGAGAFLAGGAGAAFGLFAALTVGGGLACPFSRTGAPGALALLATFFGTAGLFLLLGSDFLAMAQLLIGAGGIVALFLFGAQLAPADPGERSLPRVVAMLCTLTALGAFSVWRCRDVAAFTRMPVERAPTSDAERIGVELLDPSRFAVAFEVAGVLLAVALVIAAFYARRQAAPEEAR